MEIVDDLLLNAQATLISGILTSNILVCDFSPRCVIDEGYVESLSRSILKDGILVPILVRPHPTKEGYFELIDGEHRLRASAQAGLKVMPAMILDLDDASADYIALNVNLFRGKALDDFEIGLRLIKLIDVHNWSQRELGERLGKSQQWISQRVNLARRGSKELHTALTTRVVTTSQAREITQLSEQIQPDVINKVKQENLNYKQTLRVIELIHENPDNTSSILNRPINQLSKPPEDIASYESKHGENKSKLTSGYCPECTRRYAINWVLQEINWEPSP